MKKISLLCLLIGLLVLLVLPATAAQTSGVYGENLTWTLENGVLTFRGTGPMHDAPDHLYAPWSDSREQIKKVVISEGITSVGKFAIYEMPNLTEISLPNTLEIIGESSICSCDSLQKVHIPASVTAIEKYAFSFCDNLKELWFSGDKPIIADFTFRGVTVYLYYPPHNETWKEGRFPNSVGQLYWIPADSKEHGVCGENLTWKLQGTVLTISGSGDMNDYGTREQAPWFGSRMEITEVVVEEGVTAIGVDAFLHNENLLKVKLPNSLKVLRNRAFASCYKLESINLPEGLVTIQEDAFRSCGVKELVIPASATNIYREAFNGCSALKKMTIMGSAPIQYQLRGDIWFYADAPDIQGSYVGEKGTAYYPADNITWTKDRLVDFDGRLTWVPFGCTKHDEVTDAAVAAGCLTAGKTAGAHCSKCGVVTKAQQVIPATGHSFGDWKQTKAPTVQAAGQETRSCKNCSAVENREIPKLTQQPSGQDPTQSKPTQPEQTTPVPTDPEETVPPTVPDSTQPQQTRPEGATATDPKEDPTQPDATEQEAPKSTPWIAIAIAGGMILAGGGAAAWYFVLRKRK